MLWRTHVAGGVLAGAAAAGLAGCDPVTSAAVAGAASLVPDVDSPASKLGRLALPVSVVAGAMVGHRGALHSLPATAAFGLLAAWALPAAGFDGALAVPAAAGYASHLLLDCLNPQGVPLLWPLGRRFRVPLVGTGGILERIAFYPLAGLAAWAVAKCVAG